LQRIESPGVQTARAFACGGTAAGAAEPACQTGALNLGSGRSHPYDEPVQA